MFDDDYEFDYDRMIENVDDLYDYNNYSDEPDYDDYRDDDEHENEREFDCYYHNVMDELDD